jgi:hypothetical protein
MEDLYICVGLGDCLLYCQIYDLYKDRFKYNYVLNIKFIEIYKNDSQIYCEFVKKIFNYFKVPLKIINITYSNENKSIEPLFLLREYPLKKLSLTNYISNVITGLPNEYIVINLNIRIVDNYVDTKSILKMEKNLSRLLNSSKFKIPIVIIGHRQSYTTLNVINYSFYDKLIPTKFIDKSYDGNLINDPNFENLIYDINIVKNAKECFQFGFGGSLCLNIMFSKKLSAIMNPENDIINDYFTSNFFDLNQNIVMYNNRYSLWCRLKNAIS